MKVKCIDNNSLEGYLTKNKIYLVNKVSDDCYEITDDKDEITYYLKYRFVPVEGENMKVKCINNKYDKNCLTINKIYPVNIALEIGELVEKKDKDYNSAFSKTLKEYGDVAYFLRIDDKLNRLKSLLLRSKDAEINESVEDTLKDIVGYTLLMLKEKRA